MRRFRIVLICCGLLMPAGVSAQSFQGPCKTQLLCKGVEPGGGRLIECLRQHQRELTTTCRLAIADFFLNKPHQGRGPGGRGGPGREGPGPDGPGRGGPSRAGGDPDERDAGRPGGGPYRGGPDERAGPEGAGPEGRGADRPPPYDPRYGGPDPDRYDPEAR